MNQGYVKLYRKSIDGGWLKNHKLWVFWSYCIMKASYKERDAIIGFQTIHLMPGEFIFGLNAASKELKMSTQSLRTCIRYLKRNANITVKVTNKFSIISIINWDIYQGEEEEDNSQENNQLTSQQQTTNKPLTTNKNVKKERSKEVKALSSKEDIPFSDIVSHLNTRTKKAYRDTGAKIRSLITARWNEGFRVPDFERVIDNQVIKWEHDPKMREFLRPETIFGTKFESYLNAVPNMAQAGLISAGTQSLLSWAERKMKEAEDANGRQPEIRGIDGGTV